MTYTTFDDYFTKKNEFHTLSHEIHTRAIDSIVKEVCNTDSLKAEEFRERLGEKLTPQTFLERMFRQPSGMKAWSLDVLRNSKARNTDSSNFHRLAGIISRHHTQSAYSNPDNYEEFLNCSCLPSVDSYTRDDMARFLSEEIGVLLDKMLQVIPTQISYVFSGYRSIVVSESKKVLRQLSIATPSGKTVKDYLVNLIYEGTIVTWRDLLFICSSTVVSPVDMDLKLRQHMVDDESLVTSGDIEISL